MIKYLIFQGKGNAYKSEYFLEFSENHVSVYTESTLKFGTFYWVRNCNYKKPRKREKTEHKQNLSTWFLSAEFSRDWISSLQVSL